MKGTTGLGRWLILGLTVVLGAAVAVITLSGQWPSDPAANVAVIVFAAASASTWWSTENHSACRREARPTRMPTE
jgi:hypothetical protein